MKEIVNRLHENRQIELAKSILEANGYEVKLKETSEKRFTPISGSEISKDDQQRILDIIYSEAKFWDDAPTPIDVYSEGDSFIVKLGNSNPTYISSLNDKLRELEDERDIGYESSHNDEGFYGRDYEFFYYKD